MYLTVPIAKLRDFCNMVAEGCVCSELDVQTRHLNHDFFSIGIQYRIGIIIKQRLLARTESDTCYFIISGEPGSFLLFRRYRSPLLNKNFRTKISGLVSLPLIAAIQRLR